MSLEDHYHQHKLKLRETLTRELDAFDSIIDEDLQRRARLRLDQALRGDEQERKIRSLESDNQSLRAELGSMKKKPPHIQSTPSIPSETPSEDFVLKVEYDTLQDQFERTFEARNKLESQCRRYKKMLKGREIYGRTRITKKGPRSTAPKTPVTLSLDVDVHKAVKDQISRVSREGTTLTSSYQASESASSKSNGAFHPKAKQQHPDGWGDKSDVKNGPVFVAYEATSPQSINHVVNEGTEASTDGEPRPYSSDQSRRPDSCQSFRATHKAPSLDLDDSDIPIVVSERSLKRKRLLPENGADVQNLVDGDVKVELATSSPVIAISCRPLFAVQESLDLDNVGQLLRTPRKGQRLECMRSLSSVGVDSREVFRKELQGYTSRSHQEAIDGISTSEDDAMIHLEKSGTRGRHDFHLRNESVSGIGIEEREKRDRQSIMTTGLDSLSDFNHTLRRPSLLEVQRQASVSNIDFARDERPHHIYRAQRHQDPAVLSPMNPNIISRTRSKNRSVLSPSCRDEGTSAYLLALADDGEEFPPLKNLQRSPPEANLFETAQNGEYKATTKTVSSSPHRRLDALLRDPSPTKGELPFVKPGLTSSTPVQSPKMVSGSQEGVSVHRPKHDFFTTRIKRALQRPPTDVAKTHQTPSMKRTMSDKNPNFDEPPEVSPEQEPLRVRSVERLRLTDFKLNKDHSEFAFRESIRKHDEKRRVGACRDPFCDRCKEIARFAELTDYVVPPTSGLFDSSPMNADAAEQRQIGEFLGNDKERLKRMDAGQRKEILKKSREKSFADMYGKHRQLHNRAVSPPGYWETEFPSAQQEAANREAAKAIEKVRINERYEEAIKGGLWKFADE